MAFWTTPPSCSSGEQRSFAPSNHQVSPFRLFNLGSGVGLALLPTSSHQVSVMTAMSIVRKRQIAAIALILAGLAPLYARVIARLVSDWATDDNYSHGFLIVPLAAHFAWERRRQFAAAPIVPAFTGLIAVVTSILVLAAGVLGSELFLTRISMLGVIAGTVLFLFGWPRLRVIAFPIAFLLFMLPIPAIVFNQIALPLQLLASRTGELALNLFAIPVLREGNVLMLATTTLDVAEACSGIRSLVSLVTVGFVLGYFTESRGWARAVVAVSAIPVAIIANGVRVAGTGVAAHHFGPAAAEGFFHTFSGWLVFLVAFVMLVSLQQLVTRVKPPQSGRRLQAAA